MIAPPLNGPFPRAEETGGSWIELRDDEHETIAARPLGDPFHLHADHHSPDGQIEHFTRELVDGEFNVLIPAFDQIRSVALFSDEFRTTDRSSGAVELGQFDIARGETRG